MKAHVSNTVIDNLLTTFLHQHCVVDQFLNMTTFWNLKSYQLYQTVGNKYQSCIACHAGN